MTQTDPPNRDREETSYFITSPAQESYPMNTPQTRKQAHNDDYGAQTSLFFDTSPPLLAPDIATPLLLRSAKSSKRTTPCFFLFS